MCDLLHCVLRWSLTDRFNLVMQADEREDEALPKVRWED